MTDNDPGTDSPQNAQPTPKMNSILDYYARLAEGLPLYTRGDAPVRDARFRSFTKEDLDGTDLCNALVELYRSVFGDSDAWGEGAYCEREGRGRRVDIAEYERLLRDSKPLCECGANLIPFHPPAVLKERILREMTPSAGIDPTCILMIGDDKPVGFTWGAVLKVYRIAERLIYARYRGREDVGQREARALSDKLLDLGLGLEDYILYFDELAVNRDRRVGFDHIHFLSRGMFEHAVGRTTRALFWTSKDSAIYNVTLLCGFVPVHETADGICFMLLDNFRPLLILEQNMTPSDGQQVYAEAARLLSLSR